MKEHRSMKIRESRIKENFAIVKNNNQGSEKEYTVPKNCNEE